MPLDPLQVACDAVEAASERGLQAIGTIGRQMRGERGFDDERLRHALTIGVVSELAGEVRWQAEGESWSLKSGQSVKLFPSMRRTGLDGQGYAQAVRG